MRGYGLFPRRVTEAADFHPAAWSLGSPLRTAQPPAGSTPAGTAWERCTHWPVTDKAAGQHTWIDEHLHLSMSYVDPAVARDGSARRGGTTSPVHLSTPRRLSRCPRAREAATKSSPCRWRINGGDDSTHIRLAELAATVQAAPPTPPGALHWPSTTDALWESSRQWAALATRIAGRRCRGPGRRRLRRRGTSAAAHNSGEAARSIAAAHGFTTTGAMTGRPPT